MVTMLLRRRHDNSIVASMLMTFCTVNKQRHSVNNTDLPHTRTEMAMFVSSLTDRKQKQVERDVRPYKYSVAQSIIES